MTAGSTDRVLDRLRRSRVVPVITIDDAEVADLMADALVAGGIGAAEITLRTPAGLPAIERLAARADLTVGAGTVLSAVDATAAVQAGAAFVVSPGLDEQVVDVARDGGALPLPGIATPTELQHALRLQLSAVKVFPVKALGGAAFLRALSEPFPGIAFMPSGGIAQGDAAEYLTVPSVFAIGGSWIASRRMLAERDADAITRAARATMSMLAVA